MVPTFYAHMRPLAADTLSDFLVDVDVGDVDVGRWALADDLIRRPLLTRTDYDISIHSSCFRCILPYSPPSRTARN